MRLQVPGPASASEWREQPHGHHLHQRSCDYLLKTLKIRSVACDIQSRKQEVRRVIRPPTVIPAPLSCTSQPVVIVSQLYMASWSQGIDYATCGRWTKMREVSIFTDMGSSSSVLAGGVLVVWLLGHPHSCKQHPIHAL